jgi:hypothetical protein
VTLGTSADAQRIEGLNGDAKKRFLLYYNFPPFSVGEVRFLRGPGRREIGHGALAERALRDILPDENGGERRPARRDDRRPGGPPRSDGGRPPRDRGGRPGGRPDGARPGSGLDRRPGGGDRGRRPPGRGGRSGSDS